MVLIVSCFFTFLPSFPLCPLLSMALLLQFLKALWLQPLRKTLHGNPSLVEPGRVSPRTTSLLRCYFSYNTSISTCIIIVCVPVSSPSRAKLVMDALSSFLLVLYIQLYFSIYIEHIYKQVLLPENTRKSFWTYISTVCTYSLRTYDNIVRRAWVIMNRIPEHSSTCRGKGS